LQPYRPSDVGEFRSAVLVQRLNLFWDLKWQAVTERLFEPEQLEGIDIVIGCAETPRARAAIAAHTAGSSAVHYWLDLAATVGGNQFVLGEPQNRRNRRSRGRLPVVSELFPRIVEEGFDAEQMDARESADLLQGQDAFVSQILANHALMLLTRLFVYRSVSYHGGAIGVRGGVRPLRITPCGTSNAAAGTTDDK
jgi:PRTRC genetic system ThiF family protein